MTGVALTGATGFVGNALQRHFLELGWRVTPMTRSAEGGRGRFALGDAVDADAFDDTDILVHCAWDFSLSRQDDIRRINIGGTRQLLETARAAGVRRTVLISSMSAFPGCRSLYGRAKLACEAIAADIGAATVRPGLVHDDPNGGLFAAMENVVRRSPVVPVITGGRQNLFTCHARDLAALVAEVCMAEAVPTGPVVAAHDAPWTMRTLVAATARGLGVRRATVPVPWQAPYVSLRLLERLGRTGRFRSDSVLGLAWQNPSPDFTTLAPYTTRFRPYA